MCAAPGSKTSQMLEVVSRGASRTGVEPAGYVVANDAETSRAYMLVHQCKRISTAVRPCPFLARMYTHIQPSPATLSL